MKELRNRKGMDYCFPLGIMQDENGELYYIDPIKSLFLIILMPIRIFFPVKLYKITDAKEKQLAYGRYRNENYKKNILKITVFSIVWGGTIRLFLESIYILSEHSELFLKLLYLLITLVLIIISLIRRYYVYKLIKISHIKYVIAKIRICDEIIKYFLLIIFILLVVYYLILYKKDIDINFMTILIYLIFLPFITIMLFGLRFEYDDLKFKIIKEVKNK